MNGLEVDVADETPTLSDAARRVACHDAGAPQALVPHLVLWRLTAPQWSICDVHVIGLQIPLAVLPAAPAPLPPGVLIRDPAGTPDGVALKVLIRRATDAASGLYLQQAIDFGTGTGLAIVIGGTIEPETFEADLVRLPALCRALQALSAVERVKPGPKVGSSRKMTPKQQAILFPLIHRWKADGYQWQPIIDKIVNIFVPTMPLDPDCQAARDSFIASGDRLIADFENMKSDTLSDQYGTWCRKMGLKRE